LDALEKTCEKLMSESTVRRKMIIKKMLRMWKVMSQKKQNKCLKTKREESKVNTLLIRNGMKQ
jgi:hypothetical protein